MASGTTRPVRTKSKAFEKREHNAYAATFRRGQYPIAFEKAQGVSVWDIDGNKYLDFSSGACVANTGHCHPEVVKAAVEELERLTNSDSSIFPNHPSVDFAEKLTEVTPGSFKKKVWFGASGSTACDVFYDFLPIATGRRRIISFLGSFHGITIGDSFLSGHRAATGYLASPSVVRAPYPNMYRSNFKSPEEATHYCIDFIENQIFNNICPAEDTAAILVEPIESVSGEIVPPDDFLPQLRELCDRHGILLAADEVKTGFGRTGKMFAFDHSNTVPDVIALGKPIASGIPLSAVVGREEILDAEGMSHVSSAAGYPASCAAGLATLNVIQKEKLVENAANQGRYMKKRFEEMMERHPIIGDVRGRGLMMGLELVEDRKTKKPASKAVRKFAYRAWEKGLLLMTNGTYENCIEVAPPLIIKREDIDRGLETFEEVMSDVEHGRVPDAVLRS